VQLDDGIGNTFVLTPVSKTRCEGNIDTKVSPIPSS